MTSPLKIVIELIIKEKIPQNHDHQNIVMKTGQLFKVNKIMFACMVHCYGRSIMVII